MVPEFPGLLLYIAMSPNIFFLIISVLSSYVIRYLSGHCQVGVELIALWICKHLLFDSFKSNDFHPLTLNYLQISLTEGLKPQGA